MRGSFENKIVSNSEADPKLFIVRLLAKKRSPETDALLVNICSVQN